MARENPNKSKEQKEYEKAHLQRIMIENTLNVENRVKIDESFEAFRREQKRKRAEAEDEFEQLQKWHDGKNHWRQYYTDEDKEAIEAILKRQRDDREEVYD